MSLWNALVIRLAILPFHIACPQRHAQTFSANQARILLKIEHKGEQQCYNLRVLLVDCVVVYIYIRKIYVNLTITFKTFLFQRVIST